MSSRLSLIWVLVKRDYALQYAGSFLGISWMIIQNLTLIFIYSFVFLYLNFKSSTQTGDYTGYVFSGLLFWIPLQELLIRGTSILSDNRQLIRRSALGFDVFLWIPYFQFLIHYILTAIPISILLIYYSEVSIIGLLLSPIYMGFVGLFLWLVLHYFSRLNIILKDISPLIRLLSQLLFWSLPILYRSEGLARTINIYHPLNLPLDLFRALVFRDYSQQFSVINWLPFLIVFIFVFYFSRHRFQKMVMDHL